jgi:alcohol dehydrogenase
VPGIAPFAIARLPRIVFGDGARRSIATEAGAVGRRALVVTGAGSFRATPHWRELEDGLAAEGVSFEAAAVAGEPSPEMVDGVVAEFRDSGIAVVVGIGGGSALDAAKAIAGLLPHGNSVMDHLEGVGAGIPYRGPSLPLIAVPTTAGTGSEATKNAVLSRPGGDGFKKSFRDEALVARVAIVDPELLASCPPDLIAANGMDAFTQLLESLVSANANPMTDALAWSGLAAFRDGFFPAWEGDGADAAAGRAGIAYASLTSGITLAQTGLGSVHGLASPLGAFFPIPHGVVCGTLVAEATEVNIRALKERAPESPALDKYARAGALIAGTAAGDRDAGLDALVATLRQWTERLALPGLGAYQMTGLDIPRVVANCRGGSMKTNPIVLGDDEVAEVLARRL